MKSVKRGTSILCAAHAVIDVLPGNLEAAGFGAGPQGMELDLGVRIVGAHAAIECEAAGLGSPPSRPSMI